MTAKQKIKYVKDRIAEVVDISPKGPIYLTLYRVVENDGYAQPTLISIDEQKTILKKLEEDGYLKNVNEDPFTSDDGVWLEMAEKNSEPKKIRRSNLLSYIKTTDDLLRHRELYQKFIYIVGDARIVKVGHNYKLTTEEQNDDLIQLLIDLGIVEYDWSEMDKQKHRAVGNRLIEYTLLGDKFLEVAGRVNAKSGHIKREALELISREIGDRFTFTKMVQFFGDHGVPESMFVPDTKWRAAFYVLSYYATADFDKGFLTFLKIIQEALHPLMFAGDTAKAVETRGKYQSWLQYDGISIDKDAKVYLLPSAEEVEMGLFELTDADGKTVDPTGYTLSPVDLAKLWVLWNQIILLVSTYQSNHSLDRKELEKLYLETMGKAEAIIEHGMLFRLKEDYRRPFTSLATAELEAQAKAVKNSFDLLGMFLLKITALNPDPEEITKQTEKYSDLIARIATATRAISGEKIDPLGISHEQALFLLKLFIARIFKILQAVSTGYLQMADEKLNAQYILLYDHLDGLLQRDDCKTLKEDLPPDLLPKHLFDALNEMDIWWEFAEHQLMSFIGDIESAWVRAGQQVFPIPGWLAKYFNELDDATNQHRREKEAQWDRMTKNIDNERNSSFLAGSPSKPAPKENVEEKIIKVQLVGSSEVMIRNADESIVTKNKKRVGLPHFSRTEWSAVSLKFLDEQNVLLTGGKKTIPTNYEGLGFSDDRKNAPNRAWKFLFEMAEQNGETKTLPTPIPDTMKQLKQQVADRLRSIFKNDTDPFYDTSETKTYKAKFELIAPNIEAFVEKDDLGIGEELAKNNSG